MSDQFPFSNSQNPAPNPSTQGQEYLQDRSELVQGIMSAFRAVLPSNYVSVTNGPWYSLQFQAMAEQLADIQISTTEVTKDSTWDFTRPDFLWQSLGQLIFPGATDKSGIPQIDGDQKYRTFLIRMVSLLLQGATKASVEGGLEALDPTLIATIVERYLQTPPRDPQGGYTIKDQFFMDIFVEGSSGGFPEDPILTQSNATLVIEALKPAHVLYTYSHLFRDAFDGIADDSDGEGGALSMSLEPYFYDDTRKWCMGAKAITSAAGITLSSGSRFLFSDPTRAFDGIRDGAVLRITSGGNSGLYRVVSRRALLSGTNSTSATYTLSSGGGGTLVAISPDSVQDGSRDWGLLAIDTTITITSGSNAGTYRLDTVLGLSGGPLGRVGVSGDTIRLSQSILRLDRRMPVAPLTGQSYELDVDRLGVKTPKVVSSEDVSIQFYL